MKERSVLWQCTLLWTALLVGTAALAQPYNEAPDLAQRVSAGELLPVEERLPENPVVVEPIEQVGEYGGTWRTTLLGSSDGNWLRRTIGYEGLLRLSPNGLEVIPNAAESFEANDDATEFTFTLREGLKWSDGEPFTTDDILFWYEDVFLNEELTTVRPTWLRSGEEPVELEVQDERTFTFRFTEPSGLFLLELSASMLPTSYPRHYFEQYHTDYNPDIDALVAEAGAADWVSLFQMRGGVNDWELSYWQNPDKPTINAWMITNPYEGARVVAERNPYYFKVDTAGNQLPYLDSVSYDVVEDVEVMLLRAMAGEIDMQDRHIGTTVNRPVLFDNMERSQFRFFETVPSQLNSLLVYFNFNHEDPVKREVFNNHDFRVALSHAINRQEIIDLVYVGQGEPWQSAPGPDVPFYNERLATQYLEYDPELANQMLDEHYPERDAQGFRLGPDGNRISLTIETWDWVDEVEMIQEYWRAVGIETLVRVLERGFLFERATAALHDVTVWAGDGGGIEAILRPQNYFPNTVGALHAPVWGDWYEANGAAPNEDIPEPIMEQMRLYDQIKATASEEERLELFQQLLEIAADEFPIIGISTPAPGYGVVRNNFRNVPDSMPHTGGLYPNPAPTNPSQYFIRQTP